MYTRQNFSITPYSREKLFTLPKIPPEEWCDFRRDFESGMTLKSIAEKYLCDPRTVRKCLRQNQPSNEIGRQKAPTKLAPYITQIHKKFKDLTIQSQVSSVEDTGICSISRQITQYLHAQGYSGSERTVRNYLRSQYQFTNNQPRRKNP